MKSVNTWFNKKLNRVIFSNNFFLFYSLLQDSIPNLSDIKLHPLNAFQDLADL